MAKSNAKNVSSAPVSGPVSDADLIAAIEAPLKALNREECVRIAATLGIPENTFNSRLSGIRKEWAKHGVKVPMFKRGRVPVAVDYAAVAERFKGVFGAAE